MRLGLLNIQHHLRRLPVLQVAAKGGCTWPAIRATVCIGHEARCAEQPATQTVPFVNVLSPDSRCKRHQSCSGAHEVAAQLVLTTPHKLAHAHGGGNKCGSPWHLIGLVACRDLPGACRVHCGVIFVCVQKILYAGQQEGWPSQYTRRRCGWLQIPHLWRCCSRI